MNAPPQPKRRYEKYDDIIWNTERRVSQRRPLFIGRRGAPIIPRRFHLMTGQIERLRAQYRQTKRMPNPHNKGFYFYVVDALIGLGIDRQHPMEQVVETVRGAMSHPSTIQRWNGTTAWDRWTTDMQHERRLENSWQERFEMNIRILQRLRGFTPYGRKLLDVGQKVLNRKGGVIDLLRGRDGEKRIRLNTKSDVPRNDFKLRGVGSIAVRSPAFHR